MQYLVHTGFITVHLYCWSYQVWTWLALRSLETKVEKLKCRYINRGNFIDTDDVMNQYLFYQSCPFKNIQKCIWWKEENFLCLSSGSKIRSRKYRHNIPEMRLFRTRTSQWCFMTGKHISRISWNLWKIYQDIITSNSMLTALDGLRWRREIQATPFLWMYLKKMYNQQQDSCLMLSPRGDLIFEDNGICMRVSENSARLVRCCKGCRLSKVCASQT